MTIYDLVFICVVFISALAVILILINLLSGKIKRAGKISLYYFSFIALYLLIIISTSLFSQQRIMAPGEIIKSDDWCVTADKISRSHATAEVTVSFRIYSTAQRTAQKEQGVEAYITDETGKRFDPVNALADEGFDSNLEPGQSISFERTFNVSGSTGRLVVVIDRYGAARFPGIFIIGDNSSLLHKPVVFPVSLN